LKKEPSKGETIPHTKVPKERKDERISPQKEIAAVRSLRHPDGLIKTIGKKRRAR